MTNISKLTAFKLIRILVYIGIGVFALWNGVQAANPVIDVLKVKGSVNPVLVSYITRGIEKAEEDQAVACIIELNTPGGLDTSMHDIVSIIVDSKVPVVVFVPAGGRDASAGVFITQAAHVAAMAPNTSIGAAHPVNLDGTSDSTTDDVSTEKLVNDLVAYIRSLAETRGRNADWAEQAVRESVSISAQEALDNNVIDIIAPDLDSLIDQINDREVSMLDGTKVTVRTTGAEIKYILMNWVENFLYAIADPNVAYILLGAAALGIFAEIFNPGLIFPGILGAISGLLAFYALGMLPVNITGVLLIILGLGLFVAEAITTGFGLLFTGGLVSFTIGSFILFSGGGPGMAVNPWLIGIVVVLIAGFFGFVVERIVRVHRKHATTGKEELTGHTAITRTALSPEGQVLFRGERWQAVSESGNLEAGETVIITKMDGLTLYVREKDAKEEVRERL